MGKVLEHNTASGHVGGTWLREPDGANLLVFSPILYHDPPTAYRNRRKFPQDKWYRAEYDTLPSDVLWPEDVRKLKPGEWVRMH